MLEEFNHTQIKLVKIKILKQELNVLQLKMKGKNENVKLNQTFFFKLIFMFFI